MIQAIDNVVNAISGFLYEPYIVPLILVLAGLYFTVRLGLPQFSLFGESIRVVSEKPVNMGATSSFGALMVSTASRVGTGNIMGVSTAICLGGAGAIFWMWVTAILGGASAFVESTLAQIYKKKNPDGTYYGGPSYYIQTALKQRWLGVIFAVVLILTYAVGYNMLASYNTQDTFTSFAFYDPKVTPVIIGAILAVLFAASVLGGAKRLTKVTEVLVPIMGVLYVVVSLVVVIMNIGSIGKVFGMIFSSAFDFKAIFGGFAGSAIMWGIKRGLYSNEAGMGSAPNAAAAADVSHPAKQGLVQMLSVFIDTLLICSATAFMCLFSGAKIDPALKGAPYVAASMKAALGSFGPIFMAVAVCLFAFTTLIHRRLPALHHEEEPGQGLHDVLETVLLGARVHRRHHLCRSGVGQRGPHAGAYGHHQRAGHRHPRQARVRRTAGLPSSACRRQGPAVQGGQYRSDRYRVLEII